MAAIYDRMLCEPTTECVWILEDDVIPPLDACERLLRGFEKQVISVVLPVCSPSCKGFIAWDQQNRLITQPRTGLTIAGGNAFCCTILRRSILPRTRFTRLGRNGDFDASFYDWPATTGHQALGD